MHIMHVIDSLGRGGAERALVDLANSTIVDGHNVSLCVTRTGLEMCEELDPRITVYVLGRRFRFDPTPMRRFAEIVRTTNVDILHTHMRSPLSFVAFMKTVGLVNRPIIMHDHFGNIETDASVPLWFRIWAKNLVTHYVGVYPRLGDWARRAGLRVNQISIIDYSLNLARIQAALSVDVHQELSISSETLLGIVVANLRPAKGIDTLLEAVSMSQTRGRFHILIVGAENDKAYAQVCYRRMQQLGLEKVVTFLGKRQDVPSLLHSVGFAVMPSRSESGPLVLLEFMSAGLPFVSTLAGNLSHRVAELGGMEFVPPEDPTQLASAIDRLVTQSLLVRQQRGEAGRKIALNHFEIRSAMLRWYDLYTSILAQSAV